MTLGTGLIIQFYFLIMNLFIASGGGHEIFSRPIEWLRKRYL